MRFEWYTERVNAILATMQDTGFTAKFVSKWTKAMRAQWLSQFCLTERSDAIWSQVIKELA